MFLATPRAGSLAILGGLMGPILFGGIVDRVPLQQKVLSENDRIAAELRSRFQEHGVLCLNLISSPGSGKTSLLERTLASLPRHDRVAVLTGDIQTENDANRLKRYLGNTLAPMDDVRLLAQEC